MRKLFPGAAKQKVESESDLPDTIFLDIEHNEQRL